MHGTRTIDRWACAGLLRGPGGGTTRQPGLIPSPDASHVSVDHLLGGIGLRDDRGIKWIAFGVALALHLVVMAVKLPEIKHVVQKARKGAVLVVKKYIPPPPQIERVRAVARKKFVRRVPIPDPTPQEPEPIREPEPDIV